MSGEICNTQADETGLFNLEWYISVYIVMGRLVIYGCRYFCVNITLHDVLLKKVT